jgi:hypothetical protein
VATIDGFAISDDALVLVNKLKSIKETVATVYASYGVPLPERQYYSLNQPSEDCPQMVVSYMQTYLGAPGDQAAEAQRCTGPRTGVFNITVTRKYPVGENGKVISTQRIEDASDWGAIDSWVLMESLKQFDEWEPGTQGLGVIATVDVAAPRGGLQTTRMTLSLGLF